MRAVAEKHLVEAAAFIAVAESSDAKLAAYRKAAEEIEAAKQADSSLTNREIGGRIGKGHAYVGRLLNALDRARSSGEFQIDWQRGDREIVGTEKVAREQPEAFVRAFNQAPPKVQRQIAQQMVAEPSPGRRFIEQEVSRRNAKERKRAFEEAQRKAKATAAPLPAFMSRVVLKVNEMAASLAQLRGDFAALPEGRNRELVVHALKQLDEQIARILVEMDEAPPELGEDIIEGRVA